MYLSVEGSETLSRLAHTSKTLEPRVCSPSGREILFSETQALNASSPILSMFLGSVMSVSEVQLLKAFLLMNESVSGRRTVVRAEQPEKTPVWISRNDVCCRHTRLRAWHALKA